MSERASALVVEDSPTMRQLIALALRRLPGLAIYEVSNGSEALTAVGEQTFDIILLDLNMPIMGGFAFLERLANMAERPKVIVISTESAHEDRDRAEKLGVVGYVTKPVRAAELAATVGNILGIDPA
jgi:two-component system chemotaxis response regulator CheY